MEELLQPARVERVYRRDSVAHDLEERLRLGSGISPSPSGIAQVATHARADPEGLLRGKFGYMSPEQVRGLPVDRRSDVFAAGTILHEIEGLFADGSELSTLEKVRKANVPC